MNIIVESQAAEWFKRELSLGTGDAIRFFARYGGKSRVQPGFSLGIYVTKPTDMSVSTLADGIHFFIREDDLWYFDGHDLHIVYHEHEDDIEYVVEA